MALFGRAANCKLSLLSGIKRKLDFEPAKGSFWRKADLRQGVLGFAFGPRGANRLPHNFH